MTSLRAGKKLNVWLIDIKPRVNIILRLCDGVYVKKIPHPKPTAKKLNESLLLKKSKTK